MSNGLVVVGSVALDSVEANGTVHDDVLCGSASFFSTAASYFTPVKLVAVVSPNIETGQLTTVLEDLPAVPFTEFRLTFSG